MVNDKAEVQVQSQSWRAYLPIILAVGIGTLLSLIAFGIVLNLEQQNIAVELESAAKERVSALGRNLDHNLKELDSIAAFYAASNEVTRDEFQQFVQPFLLANSSVQALEWVPRVPNSERKAFEKVAQENGFFGFQFTERDDSGQLKLATSRDNYFPVYFVEPYEGNEEVAGFDLASNPTRLEALNLARDKGETIASARIELIQDSGGQFGLLMFKPIYQNGTPTETSEERVQNLHGFALGVFRVGDILEDALTYLEPEEIDIYLFDQSATEDQRFLYHHHVNGGHESHNDEEVEQASLQAGLHHATTLQVAGREWLVLSIPTANYVATARTWQPWGVLLTGLLFTGFLSAYFFNNMRRTAELEATNERLAEEVNERRLAEEGLLSAQQQLAKNNRVLEERSQQLAKANQDVTELSKRLKVEAIQLGAKLERQQAPQRDIEYSLELEKQKRLTEPHVVINQSRQVTEAQAAINTTIATDSNEATALSIDDVTRQLQQMLLPTSLEVRQITSLDIASHTSNQRNADNVELLLQQGPIQVGIGRDQTLMLMTGGVVRTLLTSDEKEHTDFVTLLNRQISAKAQDRKKNLALALLDYGLSGHSNVQQKQKELIIVFPDGQTSLVDGYTLGFDRANVDSDEPVQLQPIDGMVLYNTQQEDGNIELLHEVIKTHWQEGASSIVDALMQKIEAQTGPQRDFTLLVVKQS